MTLAERALQVGLLVAIGSPAVLLISLMLASIPRTKLRENTVARMTSTSILLCLLGLLVSAAAYFSTANGPSLWRAGIWFSTGADEYQFAVLVDGWSLCFALLSAIVSGSVAAFSYRYLHAEPGFHRYFVLYASFVLGMLLVSLAGSIEILFAGWELLGLSSALLVAFFHDRRAPVRNAMRVFVTYRVSDAAMLIAAVIIHHSLGSGSLVNVFLSQSAAGELSEGELLAVCLFLVAAVAGKSALLPFSGWLPRAMEGPTPSSAVYYGALSVHAGCYLLWRCGPLLAESTVAQVLTVVVGAATAIYATMVARVQSDVKSALSYATLTQVGIIVVEIALGLRTLAFVHIAGHASFRVLQFLSAPNVLHDVHALSSPDGRDHSSHASARRVPERLQLLLIERGFLDSMVDQWLVRPFVKLARLGERLDRKLAGEGPDPAEGWDSECR